MGFKFKYDDKGVPILSATDIEYVSKRFLTKYCSIHLEKAQPLPIFEIINQLEESNIVTFDFNQTLNRKNGSRVLGVTKLSEKEILIDKEYSMDRNSPQLRFTICHEIGHFAFHTNRPILDDGEPRTTISDTKQEIYFSKNINELSSVLDFIEWQANAFASNILMPKNPFKNELINIQNRMGIKRNIGKIYLEKGPSYQRDFHIMINNLSASFNVTRTAVKIRLKKLGLVIDNSISSLHGMHFPGNIKI